MKSDEMYVKFAQTTTKWSMSGLGVQISEVGPSEEYDIGLVIVLTDKCAKWNLLTFKHSLYFCAFITERSYESWGSLTYPRFLGGTLKFILFVYIKLCLELPD